MRIAVSRGDDGVAAFADGREFKLNIFLTTSPTTINLSVAVAPPNFMQNKSGENVLVIRKSSH